MTMNNLNGAESHRRFKAQTTFRDLKFINISYSEFKDVHKHFKRVQYSPNRNSKLALTSVTIGLATIFVNLVEKCFQNNVFIEHLSIIMVIAAFIWGLCFVYQYHTFEPEKNETLQEWEKTFAQHNESKTHIVDIPFNQSPPLPLDPPPKWRLAS